MNVKTKVQQFEFMLCNLTSPEEHTVYMEKLNISLSNYRV